MVYWGTPKVKDALETSQWPRVYRERNEIQEHSFKRMNDHGALKINYGRKKIVGPDRHQQRQREQLEQSLTDSQRIGLSTSMRVAIQRIAGFHRMASSTPRAADGVMTSYETRSTFISGRVKQALFPQTRK